MYKKEGIYMVRCATTSDLTAVYELIHTTIGRDLNKSMFARTFVNQLGQERHKLGVYEDENDGVIGFIGIICTWTLHAGVRIAEISEIAVDKNHRNGDVRYKLMEWGTEIACDAGCEKMILSSRMAHEASHEFYEKLGFEKTHYRFDRNL
jgi:PhnO protein